MEKVPYTTECVPPGSIAWKKVIRCRALSEGKAFIYFWNMSTDGSFLVDLMKSKDVLSVSGLQRSVCQKTARSHVFWLVQALESLHSEASGNRDCMILKTRVGFWLLLILNCAFKFTVLRKESVVCLNNLLIYRMHF